MTPVIAMMYFAMFACWVVLACHWFLAYRWVKGQKSKNQLREEKIREFWENKRKMDVTEDERAALRMAVLYEGFFGPAQKEESGDE